MVTATPADPATLLGKLDAEDQQVVRGRDRGDHHEIEALRRIIVKPDRCGDGLNALRPIVLPRSAGPCP